MRVLISTDCVVDLGTDAGGVHCAAGAVVDVRADTAHALARLGRARYVAEADDPTRTKHLTASPAELPAAPKSRARPAATGPDLADSPPLEDTP